MSTCETCGDGGFVMVESATGTEGVRGYTTKPCPTCYAREAMHEAAVRVADLCAVLSGHEAAVAYDADMSAAIRERDVALVNYERAREKLRGTT